MALIAPRNVILLARITNKWNDTVMGGRGMMGRLIGRAGFDWCTTRTLGQTRRTLQTAKKLGWCKGVEPRGVTGGREVKTRALSLWHATAIYILKPPTK
jgi:hypothetical protein